MMGTRFKAALVGLSQALYFMTHADAAQNAASRLILWTITDHPVTPGLRRALRAEVAKLVLPGFSGIDVRTAIDSPVSTSDFVVAVRFIGDCDTNSGRRGSVREPLGYVILTDGTIARSMSVNCDAILWSIRPFIRDLPLVRRNLLYARAI